VLKKRSLLEASFTPLLRTESVVILTLGSPTFLAP
jgi:hypothetical protein